MTSPFQTWPVYVVLYTRIHSMHPAVMNTGVRMLRRVIACDITEVEEVWRSVLIPWNKSGGPDYLEGIVLTREVPSFLTEMAQPWEGE